MRAECIRKISFAAFLGAVIMMSAGCGDSVSGEAKTAQADMAGRAEEITDSEKDTESANAGTVEAGTDGTGTEERAASKKQEEPAQELLKNIRLEAGAGLSAENLFAAYKGEEVRFVTELTPQELSDVGAVYTVSVVYLGQTVDVTVEVVDTTEPVIEGKDITVEMGTNVSYRKNVSATDNSGVEPSLEIDNSQVNISVPGIYPVYYTATDASGNTATVQVSLTVVERKDVTEEMVFQEADDLLAEIITPEMSRWDIAYTLWNWCRKQIQYSYSAGERSSIYAGAYEGLHDRKGDCYVYYATFAVLLDRVGIENMCVQRVGGTSDHWWNLVNIGDGWYHCDASPRNENHTYRCFMQTDEQLQWYTDYYKEHPNYYTFDPESLPERATAIVYEHY